MSAWLRRPGPGASRAERLSYVRNLQVVCLPFAVVMLAVLIAASTPGWAVVLAAVVVGLGVLDAAWLTIRLRSIRSAGG